MSAVWKVVAFVPSRWPYGPLATCCGLGTIYAGDLHLCFLVGSRWERSPATCSKSGANTTAVPMFQAAIDAALSEPSKPPTGENP